jgi:hypothetical protein
LLRPYKLPDKIIGRAVLQLTDRAGLDDSAVPQKHNSIGKIRRLGQIMRD